MRGRSTHQDSWKAPRPSWESSEEPAMQSIGQQLIEELAMPATAWMAPGPGTTTQQPGRPVKYPTAPAAYDAACSFRQP